MAVEQCGSRLPTSGLPTNPEIHHTPVLQRSPKPTGGVWVISTSVSAGTWSWSWWGSWWGWRWKIFLTMRQKMVLTCCHFLRQSAPLGRLNAHPLNSGCHGVPGVTFVLFKSYTLSWRSWWLWYNVCVISIFSKPNNYPYFYFEYLKSQ